MPRRWEAPETATQPGRLARLEETLHIEWARSRARREHACPRHPNGDTGEPCASCAAIRREQQRG